MSASPRVIVIDDHAAIRDWVTDASLRAGMEVIGAFSSIDTVPLATRGEADLIILDLTAVGRSSEFVVIQEVVAWGPPVLVFSQRREGVLVRRALDAGVAGYVGKAATADDLMSAARHVLAGGFGLVLHVDRPMPLPPGVTPSLQRVLEEIVHTSNSAELASCLNLATRTVDGYISDLYNILNTRPPNRSALVRQAKEFGF